jgi:hypothetical protein
MFCGVSFFQVHVVLYNKKEQNAALLSERLSQGSSVMACATITQRGLLMSSEQFSLIALAYAMNICLLSMIGRCAMGIKAICYLKTPLIKRLIYC